MIRSIAIAWVRRFVLCKTKRNQTDISRPLLASELGASCILLLRYVQRQACSPEMDDLSNGKTLV